MSAAQHLATVRRCFDALNREDLEILDELCTPDFVAHFPGTPGPQSRAAIKPVWQQFFVAFPGLTHTVEAIIADGDRVVVRLTITGVHNGPLQGMPPTGRTVTIGSINFFRFQGGAIAEQWVDYDALGMMQQLGVLSAAPPATA